MWFVISANRKNSYVHFLNPDHSHSCTYLCQKTTPPFKDGMKWNYQISKFRKIYMTSIASLASNYIQSTSYNKKENNLKFKNTNLMCPMQEDKLHQSHSFWNTYKQRWSKQIVRSISRCHMINDACGFKKCLRKIIMAHILLANPWSQ